MDNEALRQLQESSIDCQLCPLATQGRTQVVFGAGNPHAGLVFIGEGPGFHEDRQGIPFVGQAGKLLNQLLEGIGLQREDIYITNVVKCRPPGNRDPKPDEIEICTSTYLFKQLEYIQPTVIATLGRFASAVMLGRKDVSMGKVHGQRFNIDGRSIVPIYHPAAALHSRANMEPLTFDFQKLREYLDQGKNMPASAGTEELKENMLEGAADSGNEAGAGGSGAEQAEQMGLF